MAQPTPRTDALRQMRETKFEAEQKRLKDEASKPVDPPKLDAAQETPKNLTAKNNRKRS